MEVEMKYRWDNRYLHWGVTAFLVIAASMLFYYGIFHMKSLFSGIRTILSIMAPVIYGIAIAYLLSPIVNFLEQKLIYPLLEKKELTLKKRGKRAIRWFCVLLSMAFFLVIIYTLIMMILPQLIRSIMNIIYSFPFYVESMERGLNTFMEKGWDLNEEAIDMLNQYSKQAQDYLTTNILPQMQSMLKNISAGIFDILLFLKNFLIGAIVSLYVLADKESFVAKSKMMTYAVLPGKWAQFLIHAMRFTHRTFGGFISGKLLDSAIIGVLCYIGTTIMDMPYAVLVSVVIGVTNVIPFFGPYLGAIPCIILILLMDPIKSLYFAIFILILQQFDGNILGPKILGDSTGLSSFMVIVAIMVGGGFFGIPGMIVGVPVFAVIHAAVWKIIGHTLQKKKIPVEEEEYYNIDCIDIATGEAVPMPEEHHSSKAAANPDGFFMKVWNTAMKILIPLWNILKKYSIRFYHVADAFLTKAYKAVREKSILIHASLKKGWMKFCANIKNRYQNFRSNRNSKGKEN